MLGLPSLFPPQVGREKFAGPTSGPVLLACAVTGSGEFFYGGFVLPGFCFGTWSPPWFGHPTKRLVPGGDAERVSVHRPPWRQTPHCQMRLLFYSVLQTLRHDLGFEPFGP